MGKGKHRKHDHVWVTYKTETKVGDHGVYFVLYQSCKCGATQKVTS